MIKNVFILGLCILISLYSEMRIEKQHTQLFTKCVVPTELCAYKALQKKPLKGDHTYVVVPWVVLLNQGSLKNVQIHKVKNGFTICQHIHFRKIIPICKKMGITTVFTPHAEEEEIDGVKIIPFPHVPNNGCGPAKEKDLWFSFIGRQTHRCRRDIYRLPKIPNVFIRQITGPSGSNMFKEILAKSRFSLCPRGTGPSSIRFWESLQAGAIPVVIADAMTFPPNFDWSRCIIKVLEKEIASIPDVLAKISTEQENAMREACYEAYKLFANDNLTSVVHAYFDQD